MKNYLKGKTWIDGIKVLLALDIAIVGIGLVFQESLHILANVLGPVSRIIFGVMYLMLAAHIIKKVFPDLYADLKNPSFLVRTKNTAVEEVPQKKKSVGEIIDTTTMKVGSFVQGRAREVQEEMHKVLEDEE